MRKKSASCNNIRTTKHVKKPNIKITKLGIVSHNYRHEEQNEYRDFSYHFNDILRCLDKQKCDSVLFSLFTIVSRSSFETKEHLCGLKYIKSVFIEEICDNGSDREPIYVVYYKTSKGWQEYEFRQMFGEGRDVDNNEAVKKFLKETKTRRILGNCAVILCGETNIVRMRKRGRKREIVDENYYLKCIPVDVKVLLNPVHDRMTNYMILKRKFLSENNKWVVSVWNKGKIYNNGIMRNEKGPAWTVYHNGSEFLIDRINCTILSNSSIEMGILDMRKNDMKLRTVTNSD